MCLVVETGWLCPVSPRAVLSPRPSVRPLGAIYLIPNTSNRVTCIVYCQARSRELSMGGALDTLQASWHPLWGCEAATLNIVEAAIGGMGRAKRSRSASTTLREVPGAESGARAPEPVSRATETGNALGLIPASPPRSPSPAQRGRKRAFSATPTKRAGAPPPRPTQREEAGAARVVERLKAAGLVQHVGRRPSLKVVACAVVLHRTRALRVRCVCVRASATRPSLGSRGAPRGSGIKPRGGKTVPPCP